jgi:hypothetical protein
LFVSPWSLDSGIRSSASLSVSQTPTQRRHRSPSPRSPLPSPAGRVMVAWLPYLGGQCVVVIGSCCLAGLIYEVPTASACSPCSSVSGQNLVAPVRALSSLAADERVRPREQCSLTTASAR